MKAERASAALAALMLSQAVLSLAFPHVYRDTGYIRETWFGNDLVTLLVASPCLIGGLVLHRRGSARGWMLWAGGLGYAFYNYAFYLLGADINALFPLYALMCVTAAAALILALRRVDVTAFAAEFGPRTPTRLVGGYLVTVATGLTAAWLGMWGAHVFGGRPTPVDPASFRLVAALDLTLMVPALAVGGVLLIRRRSWGYVISAIAGVQGTLYLLVLSVNSALSIVRGSVEPPGELPVWGALFLGTGAATAGLLASVRR